MTIFLGQNETDVQINLQRKFNNVVMLRIDEFLIVNPNGGAVVPPVYLIDFGEHLSTDNVNTNARSGWPIAIDNATVTHTVYEKTRDIALQTEAELNNVRIRVRDLNGATPTYDNLVIWAEVIVRETPVNFQLEKAKQVTMQRFQGFQNDWREQWAAGGIIKGIGRLHSANAGNHLPEEDQNDHPRGCACGAHGY